LIRLEFGAPRVRIADEEVLERLVKRLFSQRRKTLANGLKSFHRDPLGLLAAARIDPKRRPETLDLVEIGRLVELIVAGA
jgi:16S rRNA A1518/A1519 N6-dimethyltransferase RsmA/KsgA/DIM1 with predicted DNA glycosylase/AP lyase activity